MQQNEKRDEQSKLKNLIFIRDLMEEGKIKPVMDECYALSKTAEVFRYFANGNAREKVVITNAEKEQSNHGYKNNSFRNLGGRYAHLPLRGCLSHLQRRPCAIIYGQQGFQPVRLAGDRGFDVDADPDGFPDPGIASVCESLGEYHRGCLLFPVQPGWPAHLSIVI
jgi:hypothetical protein